MEVGVRSGTTLKTISATPANTPWVHVVAVFFNGTLSLYQNGTLSATNSAVGFTTVPSHTDEAGFGGTNGTNVFGEVNKSYNGCADEIMIFDKALTSEEIGVLYQAELDSPTNKIADKPTTKPESKISTDLILYPNPTKGDINLITEVKEAGLVKIQIIDLQGKIVYEKNLNIGVGFQLIALKDVKIQAATYIVKVVNGGNEQTGRLVVEE
jgi:hypothetical protein